MGSRAGVRGSLRQPQVSPHICSHLCNGDQVNEVNQLPPSLLRRPGSLRQTSERSVGLPLRTQGQLADEPDSFNMLVNERTSSFLYSCEHVSTLAVAPLASSSRFCRLPLFPFF